MFKELVRTMASYLVDHPSEVMVKEIPVEGGSTIELKVAKNDIGKVIGRDGRTAQSMRTVLFAAAQRENKRVQLEIMD